MKIFIAGSVRKQIPEKYRKEAQKFAEYIIENQLEVYCCPDTQGIIYEIIQKSKSKNIHLCTPKIYLKEVGEYENRLEKVTDTINERTDYMFQNADISIFLPGGIGTLYEMLSCIETKRAREHMNKIIIVNSYGFFDNLFQMLDKIYKEKFASEENKKVYQVAQNIEEAIKLIENLK